MGTLNKGSEAINPYNRPRIYKKETWFNHCSFGLKVGIRLLITSLILLLNSIIPYIPIPTMFRIHDTSNWLGQKSWSRQQERMRFMRNK